MTSFRKALLCILIDVDPLPQLLRRFWEASEKLQRGRREVVLSPALWASHFELMWKTRIVMPYKTSYSSILRPWKLCSGKWAQCAMWNPYWTLKSETSRRHWNANSRRQCLSRVRCVCRNAIWRMRSKRLTVSEWHILQEGYLHNFLVSFVVDFHCSYHLLHVSKNHVKMLVVRLQTEIAFIQQCRSQLIPNCLD